MSAAAIKTQVSPAQIKAMDALFAFADAMSDGGGLSTSDLIDVMELAIDGGWDMLSIQLTMAGMAVEEAKKRKGL